MSDERWTDAAGLRLGQLTEDGPDGAYQVVHSQTLIWKLFIEGEHVIVGLPGAGIREFSAGSIDDYGTSVVRYVGPVTIQLGQATSLDPRLVFKGALSGSSGVLRLHVAGSRGFNEWNMPISTYDGNSGHQTITFPNWRLKLQTDDDGDDVILFEQRTPPMS